MAVLNERPQIALYRRADLQGDHQARVQFLVRKTRRADLRENARLFGRDGLTQDRIVEELLRRYRPPLPLLG